MLSFASHDRLEKLSEGLGYVCSYALFTTMLFLVLHFTHRLPASWTILHIAAITFVIALIGAGLERLLR